MQAAPAIMNAYFAVLLFTLVFGVALIAIAIAFRDTGRRVTLAVVVWIVLLAVTAVLGGWWDRVIGGS